MPLSTHVLDVAHGAPAANLEVSLYRVEDDDSPVQLATAMTDGDGRIAAPFGGDISPGTYELVFHASAYFARHGVSGFYGDIPVRFRVADSSQHYHVPLLLSPWSYSTYRGS